MMEQVAIFFYRESSWPMDPVCVSMSPALAGGFFTTEPYGKPCFIIAIFKFLFKKFNFYFVLEYNIYNVVLVLDARQND